ncbi:ABC transporter substrate-binding protein [Lederbergia lenta]|uniref:Sugar ABC transporter substrate-binding protein n=1 Tax=Lederbergia lenta TaxID=1467 RepID=A0A2X4VSL4_LEDLE|nr:extracellular solute-binding protein [Lederbergia lenta]MCM3110907.1 extracellular solute-binding protein [Lederbergia lenta]MEC2325697.1 extracellular solute-binding protein [Lederbergia lenta]SQI53923.1 sugar ABC transporter substrate-binding protein [Lederbergia lenta]
MNNRFKKLFYMVSFLSIISLLLVACNNSEKTEGSKKAEVPESENAMDEYVVGDQFKAKEELTFSMLFSDHPNYPYDKNWLLIEELKERTNINLEMTVVPMSDYAQKRSLLISSGDAPLIIPKTYPGEETPFVASGTILPISDYVDLMPNFKDKVEKWEIEPFLEGLRKDDGKYYLLPGMHENVWPDYTLAIRTDIVEELGMEMPTTWEELEKVLVAMKEAYPESIPFSDRWEFNSTLNVAAAGFGTVAGWGLGSALKYEEEQDEFVFAPATDEYKSMLTYLHGLVEKGLLDPESVTQDDDQATKKFINGDSFVIGTNSQTVVDYRKDMNETLGEGNFSIQKIVVPGGPAGQLMGGSKLENGVMISAKAKDDPNFEALLQFVDWLWYSDEGQEFAKWGVEDTTYTKNDDGKRVLTDDVNYVGLNPNGTKALNVDFGFSGGNFAYGGTTELLHSMFSEEEIEFQNAMRDTKELVLPDPPIKYEEMELEQANLISTPLKDFVGTATYEFILGDRDLSKWDEFITELESMRMQDYVDLANEVYKKQK